MAKGKSFPPKSKAKTRGLAFGKKADEMPMKGMMKSKKGC